MNLTVQQFVDQLADSGVLSREEILAGPKESSSAVAASGLADELVHCHKLTRYQAKAAAEGRARSLVFGEYILLEPIGCGGMGRVFRARHRRMDRTVAIKILPEQSADSESAMLRFQREIKIAASLNHPNIVTAFDAGEAGGSQYLVMELIDGRDLKSICLEHGPLTPLQAVRCAMQAAQGLAVAHAQGIVHRDVKPSNLMVDRAGTLKILDLGLARLSESDDGRPMPDVTATGQTVGTVDYMAPEQAQSAHRVDARADIYSLGCTLYTLLTARPAYGGNSIVERVLAHRLDPIPSLKEACPGVPTELEDLFQRMMAKSPTDRPQEMTEVAARLRDIESAMSIEASSQGQTVLPLCVSTWVAADDQMRSPVSTVLQERSQTPLALPAPTRRTGRRVLLALCAASLLVAGIVIVIKRKDGTVIAKVPLPEGASLQFVADVPKEAGGPAKAAPAGAIGKATAAQAAARRILDLGGSLDVVTDGKRATIKTTEELPSKDFTIHQVDFRDNKRLRDDDLKLLAAAPQLHALYLGRTPTSDAALEHLSGLTGLSTLDLFGTLVTDRGLSKLAGLQKLGTINLSRTEISDDGLAHLAQMSGLNQVTLQQTKVTSKGLADFRAQLPACKVIE